MSWESINLSEAFKPLKASPFTRDELNYTGGQYQNVHYGDILVRFPSVVDVIKEDLPYVNDSAETRCGRCTLLQNGDVIIADTAEDEAVGKAIEIQGIDGQKVISGLHTMAFRPKEGLFAPGFLGYFLNSSEYHNQLLPLMQGIKVLSISKSAIADTVIKYPSYDEQERIVESLSGVDDLIGALDEAIAKKQQIKEGLMQQLLTGKTRLPGFTGEWSVKKMWELTAWDKYFNEVDRFKQVKVIKYPYLLAADLTAMALQNGDVCLLATGDFDGWTTAERAGKYLCEGEVVSIPWGGYANIKYTKGKFVTADNRIATSLNTNVLSNKYLYYYMLTNQDLINSFYRGAGIQHPSMLDVLDMDIRFPSIEEQQAIVMTLSVSEDEIKELKKKREKYSLVKQGMMQDLLTGKTRLL